MGHNRRIAVIGLGYVGLPVAVAFGLTTQVIGYDIDSQRISQLQRGLDVTGEINWEVLTQSDIFFTTDKSTLQQADFFIITVPTPLDPANQPDLRFLHQATHTVGEHLKEGDIVVFESTVYPGATQEECIPLLERASKLKAGVDFTVGYSPERINPGDKTHTFNNITKIISGLDEETVDTIADVYSTVVKNVYRASSIKAAEAAKLIENTQRDVNIALMNEFALIFQQLGISTQDVLQAAKTKWNFLPFQPGLVGGHCIGVAPHYLNYKAEQNGFYPAIIQAGRRTNEAMGKYLAEQTIKKMIQAGSLIKGARIGVLGITFKEDCSDLRHSKMIEVIKELSTYGIEAWVHDPIADREEAYKEYEIELVDWEEMLDMDALVIGVAHQSYKDLPAEGFAEKLGNGRLIMDVKAILNRESFAPWGIEIWQL